jgi:two-component system OmpR family sensor kinase
MASLRARLLAGLLALAAAGLLVLAGVTYADQRSFLLERVDQQVHSAPGAIGHAIDEKGGGPIGADHDEPGGGPHAGASPAVGLPPGTYGQRRDANGKVLSGDILLSYGQSAISKPTLPAKLPVNRVVTVSAKADDSARYRVLATPTPAGGGVTVVAVPLTEVDQTLHQLLLVEGLVIAGVLLVLGIVAWLVVRIGLLPLDRMGRTAGAIAGGDLSHRVDSTDPRTEVGRLGIALNSMLDRLEGAFAQRQESEDRLRRFIADASHELRTPLASIRGYAELFRIGATREPGETERAMQRIEDEASRMGVLVEDLLALARLDQMPDVPHAEVDLEPLARDAVDDARAMAPDREIGLRVAPPVAVVGDAHQLRQVLANLLRNALVHTPAGTPIEVAVERSGAQVRVEVRDHGPGLPAGDPNGLFERFWRAEPGRERGRAGAGLGLAIVAAIVDTHGGTVSAASAEGGGASFTVLVPSADGAPAAAA